MGLFAGAAVSDRLAADRRADRVLRGRFFKVARWAAFIAIGLEWIPFVIAAQVIGAGSMTVVIGA